MVTKLQTSDGEGTADFSHSPVLPVGLPLNTFIHEMTTAKTMDHFAREQISILD
jgi:hypothetical protein